MGALQLWGGLECTVNRTGDDYIDQSRLNGHHDRPGDLELFASLGLKAIRYPVLWERLAPDRSDEIDWAWTDARLTHLRDLDIRVIAGLVHHGSGPRRTNLLDDRFAPGLGEYAGHVAERYPWIEDWTPINEPLTTARFSALYGYWYPHTRDEGSFWLALLNQIDATRLAMRAIRRINPAARLIQTDDLGRTYATIRLAEQAAFDNLRRWAGWDLLFGRVTPHHPLWERLSRFGLTHRLQMIADDPCPPDVVGVNHYLTSDRFLDHRLQLYPPHTRGGNRDTRYVDVEAIRVLDPSPAGLAGVLGEAWQRYRTPLAVTEVHLGCTREEQLRWASEAWDTALALRGEGVDIRAVTAWALLGSHGWNTLLTAPGTYEPGVFDVSGSSPRPTALAQHWRALSQGISRHPVSGGAGWWRRPERLLHASLPRPAGAPHTPSAPGTRKLLICGATGTLGRAFARACAVRGIDHAVIGRDTLDLEQPDRIGAVLDDIRPWAIVNATGRVRVNDAEGDERACHRINATGAIALAKACGARGVQYLGFSSDLMFDGEADRPCRESDIPNPPGAYGRSKAAMEAGCLPLPGVLIVPAAAFFPADDPDDLAAAVLDTPNSGRSPAASENHVVTPTFVPALVDAALDLLIDGAGGIWHLSHGEALNWAEFARRIATASGRDADRIRSASDSEPGWRAPRPRQAALVSERGATLAPLQECIDLLARQITDRVPQSRAA